MAWCQPWLDLLVRRAPHRRLELVFGPRLGLRGLWIWDQNLRCRASLPFGQIGTKVGLDGREASVLLCARNSRCMWEFPQIRGVPYFGVLIIRILLFRVLY